MAATNTSTTLASRLKVQYPKGITQLVPKSTDLMRRLKFKEDISPGANATFDVQLTHEAGFTVGTGELTLAAAVAQETASAIVSGYQIILRSRVSYELIKKARDTEKAFAKFNDAKFIPMVESFQKRSEILAMGYGRMSLGKVTANNSGVLTISADTWCPQLWLGSKGCVLEAFSAVSGGSQHDSDLTVSAISVANRTVTVTGTSSSVVNGDYLFFKGHRSNAPYGLIDIAANTGTLYNISASTYELWSANTFDVGTSALTLAKILEAAAKASDKGCDQKLVCYVPNPCFQKLVSDEAALVRHEAGKKKAENGFESIVFMGVTGEIEIVPYMFIKQGEFIMFPENQTYRIGSSDMTAAVGNGGDIVFDLESVSSKEMRLFAEWTVFCERPGWIVYGTRSDGAALHT